MKKCTSCNSVISVSEALFCPYCGFELRNQERLCGKCGYTLQPDYKFCPICGTSACFDKEVQPEVTKKPIIDGEEGISTHRFRECGSDGMYYDYVTKRSDKFSYCINDKKPNDLRVIKIYRVMPDTVYFITADVMTKNVVNHENKESPIGACISSGAFNCSSSLLGTSDWQTVGVLGRSDDMGALEVSLNLGYNFNTCTGEAWFENINVTPAADYTSGKNTWRFLAVVVTDTGIDTIDRDTARHVKLSHQMSPAERAAIKKSLSCFKTDLSKDAGGLFDVDVDLVEMSAKCTEYTKTNVGYTITAPSAREYLRKNGIDISGYDHVIMIACLPSLPAKYYGLGGSCIDGKIGYSFVLHTNADKYIEYLNGRWDGMWAPAIYVHEFLHSIEATSRALGLEVPKVDGERFGYSDRNEWREWYRDFIRKELKVGGKQLGVDPRIWKLRPSVFYIAKK